jgi:hypothetical protein
MNQQRANPTKKSRGGKYKLVFKPAEYTGTLRHFNSYPDDEKPLLTFKNNSLRRCYILVEKFNMVLAHIYDQEAPANTPPVAVYTAQNQWNNPTI